MIRLGLCCLFNEVPIHFRTTTVRKLTEIEKKQGIYDRLKYVSSIVLENALALQQAILYCAQKGIGCFRIGSGLFPCYTHPLVGYTLQDLPNGQKVTEKLKEAGSFAAKYSIRLVMHPDQFVVLNSPTERTVDMAVAELEYHAIIAELVNVDVINIHVGGVYNDKPMAMERFVLNFSRLSKSVQDRLTLENDDKQYCPEDVLQLCHTLRVPFVYDVHHHRQEIVKRLLLSNSGHFTRCTYGLSLPEEIIAQTTMAAVETWKNREPLFHLSSPALGWGSVNQRPHHEMIDYSDFPTCWKFRTIPFTLEVEAKAKEVAVLQLNDALTSDGVAVRSCIVAMEETWDAIEIDGESKYRRRKVRVKTSQGTIHKLSSSSKRSKAAASSERKGRTRSQRNGANVVKANLQDVQGSVKSEKRIITRSITRKNASRNLN
ncbi:UV damage endonuclease UvdE [Trichuris suis]|nr:UV damage endonuclease UvdE [Trichuris suis]